MKKNNSNTIIQIKKQTL